MSSVPHRSCIKPTGIRNPWVSEETTCESSNSSSIHSHSHSQHSHDLKTRTSHGVLAAQYATPYQGQHSSTHSQSTSGHSGHSMPTESETHPMVSPSSGGGHSAQSSGMTANISGGQPQVVGGPTVLLQQAMNGTQSVYSMSGPHLQAPHPGWHDHKVIWAAPASAEMAHATTGGRGVFTVAGDNRTSTICPTTQLMPGNTGTLPIGDYHPTSNMGWCGTAVVDSGKCYQCNMFCFRCAQVVFVLGIIAGFSLLVAGGVYHKHEFPHLQVLVYIGAMISLVCIVLLVIFCAVNRRPSYKRVTAPRATSHHSCIDPENVPLRVVSDGGGTLDPTMCPGVRIDPNTVINNQEFLQCIVRPNNPSACSLSSTNPSAYSVGSKSVQFNLNQYDRQQPTHVNSSQQVRPTNECIMNKPMMAVQPTGEMYMMNPVNHPMQHQTIGGAPIVGGTIGGTPIVAGTSSHQGCLVNSSSAHGNFMPLNTAISQSSQIVQSHYRNNRYRNDDYHGTISSQRSSYKSWRIRSSEQYENIKDVSSKL